MTTFLPLRAGLSVLAFVYFFTAQAAIHTVNNNNPSPGQFTTINDAIVAASPGDVILIQGSPTTYAGFDCDKDSLTFYGTGLYPQSNQAMVASVAASDIEAGVRGCKFYGLNIDQIDTQGSDIDDITIEYCRIWGQLRIDVADCNNWLIRNCVFDNSYECFSISNFTSSSNIIISFNVFHGYFSGGGSEVAGQIIKNNLFLGGSGGYHLTDLQFAIIENNIFHSRYNAASTSVQNCTFNNNLTDPDSASTSYNNILPPPGNAGSNNIERQDPMFVQGVPVSTGAWQWNPAGRNYRLQAGSPGAGAGVDGGDLGIYGGHASSGGVNLFSETLEPPIPYVQDMNIINSSAPSSGSINVNLSLRNRETEVE